MTMAASQPNAKAAVGKLQSTRGESISINLLTNVQSRLATQATASAPAVLAAHPNMAIAIIEPVTD